MLLPRCRQSIIKLGVRSLTTSTCYCAKRGRRSADARHARRPVPRLIRRHPIPPTPPGEPPKASSSGKSDATISNALQQAAQDNSNGLLGPVQIPEDPHAILLSTHPVMQLLDNSSVVIHRQIEMMNLMVGFEQANKYVINDAQGNVIGFLAEQEHGLGNAVARQTFRTHRSFTTHVFDRNEKEVLRVREPETLKRNCTERTLTCCHLQFHRPFSWISSRIRVYDALSASGSTYTNSNALSGTSMGSIASGNSAQTAAVPISDMRIVGEAQQLWAPLRRKYNLYLQRELDFDPLDHEASQLTSGDLPLSKSTALQVAEDSSENIGLRQFASVDEPFLSWDFTLKSKDGHTIGSVNRNFAGFGREIFTDTGVYALRMDSAGLAAEPRHLISQTGQDAKSELEADQKKARGMTLDQRAVMLATAVSIDFDYFSRQRHGALGGFMPLWLPFPGESLPPAEGGADAGGAAGEGGAAGTDVDGAGSQTGFDQPMEDPYSSQGQGGDDDFWGGFGGGGGGDGSSGGGGQGGGGGDEGGGWGLGDFFDDE